MSVYPDGSAQQSKRTTIMTEVASQLEYWTHISQETQSETNFALHHTMTGREIKVKQVETTRGDQVWNCVLLTADKPRTSQMSEIATEKEAIPEKIKTITERSDLWPQENI